MRRFLPYHHGVPGSRWLRLLMNRIDAGLFAACFQSWAAALRPDAPALVANDGKTSRGSHDRASGRAALHLVDTQTHEKGLTLRNRRFYVASRALSADQAADAIRRHWRIETSLHWVLDVTFNEDRCRCRTGHGPANMAVVRHFAFNLLRTIDDRRSIKLRRKRAARNNPIPRANPPTLTPLTRIHSRGRRVAGGQAPNGSVADTSDIQSMLEAKNNVPFRSF